MIYPWDVLEIEQTDDKKVIKKAYAKLIRKYRPDEKPDKFQEINQAYQYALKLIVQVPKTTKPEELVDIVLPKPEKTERAKHKVSLGQTETKKVDKESNSEVGDKLGEQSVIGIEQLDQNLDKSESVVPDEELKIIEAVTEESEYDENFQSEDSLKSTNGLIIDTEQKIVDELFEKTHQMAFATIHEKLNKDNWDFLSEFHQILDFEIRDVVSKRMFRQVAKYNFFQLKENKSIAISLYLYTSSAKITHLAVYITSDTKK